MRSALDTLSREAQLLLCCAGPSANDASIAALVRDGLDWRRVGRLTARARAVPVVVRRIEAAIGEPLHSAPALRRMARVEEFELTRIQERLDQTLEAFHSAGITTTLLKGAALSKTVYRSVTDRPMLDLDVLVPVDDAERASAVACDAGWMRSGSGSVEAFFRTHHHLAPLHDRRGTRAILELHTGLFPAGHPFRLDGDDIRGRAVRLLDRPHAWVPATEDHLVYLAAHCVWSHMINPGAWRALRDVGALVDRGGVEWSLCLRRARETRSTTCLYWTLRLARSLAGVPVPPQVLNALEPPTPGLVLSRLERHFAWQMTGARSCPSVKLAGLLWTIAIRPTWSEHGDAKPWANPEIEVWAPESLSQRRSARERLAESVRFASALVLA